VRANACLEDDLNQGRSCAKPEAVLSFLPKPLPGSELNHPEKISTSRLLTGLVAKSNRHSAAF